MEIALDTAYRNPQTGLWYRVVRAPVRIHGWREPMAGFQVQEGFSDRGPWERRLTSLDWEPAEAFLQQRLAQSV
jgi:hypothetical protein